MDRVIGIRHLHEGVCALVEGQYGADTRRRFANWLRSVQPTKASLALMLCEMALRQTPIGKTGEHCYSLVGFGPDGEPLIDLHAVR